MVASATDGRATQGVASGATFATSKDAPTKDTGALQGAQAQAVQTAPLASALDAGGISLDFIAAGPFTYNHVTGAGGAYDDRTISKNNGVVESLEGGDFKCGDRVVFFTAITAEPGSGSGSIDLDYTYDGQTTSGGKVGFDDILSASINSPDSGNENLSGDEAASIQSEQFITSGKDRLETTIRVDGVDGGEQIILRMVVELYCDPNPGHVTGNILTTLDSAAVVGGQGINSGEQTVPLKQAGNILLPGLNVLKTCPASATVGTTITYVITVENSGQDTLNDLVVNDPLLGGNLAGYPSSLSPGQSVQQSFPYTLGASPDPVVNEVTATATGASSNTSVSDSADCTTDVLFPDLSVVKTANPAGPVSAGDTIGFDITVTNNGDGVATDVELTDTLPTDAGLNWSFSNVTGGWSCSISSGVLTCGGQGFDLAAGDSASVHISSPTTSASCGTISNTAVVDASNDNQAQDSDSVVVQCPDLEVVKTADADHADAGDTIGYTITVTNNGPGTATGVVMTDTLPMAAGLNWSFDGVTGGWSCSISAGVLTCGGPNFDLGSGDSASVHISSPTTSATCGTIMNLASVSADNNPTVTSGLVSIVVDCAEIQVVKTADDDVVDAAEPIGYTITVTNAGAGTAKGVTLTDTLPTNAGLSWSIDATTGGWTCQITSGVLTCGGPTFNLAFGASASVHITSPTNADTCGQVDNTASVTTTNDGSGSDDASITVNCPDLGIQIVKSGPDLAHVGDTITYTFDVSLTTPEPLFDVVVTDPNCDEGAPVLVSQTGGDTDAVLEPGETWSYECTHLVTEDDSDPLPNTAVAEGTADDGRSTRDEDSHEVDLIHPGIEIVKTVDPDIGAPGDTVTYTFEVTNTGDTTLYNVSVDDDVIGHIGDIDELAADETVTLTADFVLPSDEIEVVNVGTAIGTDVLGRDVKDDDDAFVTIVETKNPIPPKPTAFTGSDAGRLALVAGALLMLGLGALTIGRRRRADGV